MKPRKFQLTMTFKEKDAIQIREEVANRMESGALDQEKSLVDKLCYTAAWCFHQEILKPRSDKRCNAPISVGLTSWDIFHCALGAGHMGSHSVTTKKASRYKAKMTISWDSAKKGKS